MASSHQRVPKPTMDNSGVILHGFTLSPGLECGTPTNSVDPSRHPCPHSTHMAASKLDTPFLRGRGSGRHSIARNRGNQTLLCQSTPSSVNRSTPLHSFPFATPLFLLSYTPCRRWLRIVKRSSAELTKDGTRQTRITSFFPKSDQ